MSNLNNIDYFVNCNNYEECNIIINDDLNKITNFDTNFDTNFNTIFNYFKIVILFTFSFILSSIYVAICVYYPNVKNFEILYNKNKEYYEYDPFFFECLNEFYNLKNFKLTDKDLKKLKNKFIKKETKFGTIILNYDYKNESFNYYTKKSNTIPFEYLEVISRIYVVQFNCKSIYIDFYDNNEINEITETNQITETNIFYKKNNSNNNSNSNSNNSKDIVIKNKYKYKGSVQKFINLNRIYKYFIYNIDCSNNINKSNNEVQNYFFFKIVSSKNNYIKSMNNQDDSNINYNENQDNENQDNENYNNDFNELNILNNIDLNNSEELEKYFCSDLDYSSFEDIESNESNECKYNLDVNSKISFKDYKNKNKNKNI